MRDPRLAGDRKPIAAKRIVTSDCGKGRTKRNQTPRQPRPFVTHPSLQGPDQPIRSYGQAKSSSILPGPPTTSSVQVQLEVFLHLCEELAAGADEDAEEHGPLGRRAEHVRVHKLPAGLLPDDHASYTHRSVRC
jgi:hypothetical protein